MIEYKLAKNKISFENGIEITLGRELITQFDLKRREVLSEEEYGELLLKACENYSYYLLGIKNYFKKDLKTKLKEKFRHEDIIESIVFSLEEKGYIDDLDSAKSYILSHGSYGEQKLRFELSKRGVAREIIEEILSENSESEEEALRKQIAKMCGKPHDKIIASLMRRGFNYQKIKKILGESEC